MIDVGKIVCARKCYTQYIYAVTGGTGAIACARKWDTQYAMELERYAYAVRDTRWNWNDVTGARRDF